MSPYDLGGEAITMVGIIHRCRFPKVISTRSNLAKLTVPDERIIVSAIGTNNKVYDAAEVVLLS